MFDSQSDSETKCNFKIFQPTKTILRSGINKKQEVFKHVDGCYGREPPVKPISRLVPRDRCQNKSPKTFHQHHVTRSSKFAGTFKNAQTQTESPANEFHLNLTNRKEEEESSKIKLSDSDKLKEIDDFRKSNYFETHSTSTFMNHKCVHKFKINRRLLPEAVNADQYGISRCAICDKPLESPMVSPSPRGASSSRNKNFGAKNKNFEKLKKRYECKLKAPAVNIGTGKEVIKINVPLDFEEECFDEGKNFDLSKKMAPFDSFALRYQKGVI